MLDISSTLIVHRRRIIPLPRVCRIFTIRLIVKVRVRRRFRPGIIIITITSLLQRRTTVVCLSPSRFHRNWTPFFGIRADRRTEKTNIRGRWPRSCPVSPCREGRRGTTTFGSLAEDSLPYTNGRTTQQRSASASAKCRQTPRRFSTRIFCS